MNLIIVIATLKISVIAFLVLTLRRLRNIRSKRPIAPLKLRPAPAGDKLATNSPTPAPFDAIYWAQLNEWHLAGQADDRRPMNGSVGNSSGSALARRSVARQSHQVMYKEWSKQRHD